MKITKLEKTCIYGSGLCRISLDIEIDMSDFAHFDYEGLDMIPDDIIPDILTAIGRMYKGKIKKGKILREKIGSLIP